MRCKYFNKKKSYIHNTPNLVIYVYIYIFSLWLFHKAFDLQMRIQEGGGGLGKGVVPPPRFSLQVIQPHTEFDRKKKERGEKCWKEGEIEKTAGKF